MRAFDARCGHNIPWPLASPSGTQHAPAGTLPPSDINPLSEESNSPEDSRIVFRGAFPPVLFLAVFFTAFPFPFPFPPAPASLVRDGPAAALLGRPAPVRDERPVGFVGPDTVLAIVTFSNRVQAEDDEWPRRLGDHLEGKGDISEVDQRKIRVQRAVIDAC